MRSGHDLADARERLEVDGFPQVFETLSIPVLPEGRTGLAADGLLIDYDPRPALERIEVPVLALFGADAPDHAASRKSVAVLREAARPTPAGRGHERAGHRLETGDPPTLVDGYLETLSSFILNA